MRCKLEQEKSVDEWCLGAAAPALGMMACRRAAAVDAEGMTSCELGSGEEESFSL
jgi:hypothetical protein